MSNSNSSPLILTERLLNQARNWLGECTWENMDREDFAAVSDAAVERGIARHYEGGIEQFIAAGVECPICDGFKPTGLRCCEDCKTTIGLAVRA